MDDLTVLAVRDSRGRLAVGPARTQVLAAGEILIVVGQEQEIGTLGVGSLERPSAPSSERSGGLQRFLRRH